MTKRASKKSGKEVRDAIQREMTDRIIAAVKAGTPPWRKPWACSPNAGWHQNIVSKKPYRGMNPLLLECTCMDLGYASRWWGTFNQWNDLGCQVKPRPKDLDYWGTRIVFWKPMEGSKPVDENDPDGEKKKFKWFMLKTYVVFNLEQVDDPDGKLAKYHIDKTANQIEPKAVEDPVFDMAREVVAATKADIRHGGERAFYTLPQPYEDWPKHKKGDYITVPEPARFVSPQDYYYTLLHEIGHWTEVRLGQKDDKYAFNELVAEIASCFIASACNIPETSVRDNHERYVASWLSRMGDDPSFIFRASSAAAKACDYVLHFSGHAQIEEDESEEEEKPKRKPRSTKKQQAA